MGSLGLSFAFGNRWLPSPLLDHRLVVLIASVCFSFRVLSGPHMPGGPPHLNRESTRGLEGDLRPFSLKTPSLSKARRSLPLAFTAAIPDGNAFVHRNHLALNMMWNAQTDQWNRQSARRARARGRRSPDGKTIPDIERYPQLHGEVRIPRDMHSSLFITDGQIFSDVGIPVVLFMENYDINRVGYHDTHDNMSNIDLDYGAALAAITIESVARTATEKGPDI